MQLSDLGVLAAVAAIAACAGVAVDRAIVRHSSPSPHPDHSRVAAEQTVNIGDDSPARRPGFDMSRLTIPDDQIKRGGPGKDGIPALTQPPVTDTADAAFLAKSDRVVAVTVGASTRLYPLRVLVWHEIINDRLAARPIAVIYCPLCDSVSVVDRRVGDETLEFGVSGLLYNSNVLLYDRTHHALWSQLKLEAVSGPMAGQRLQHLPFDLLHFGSAKTEHPDSTIVTLDTGHRRDYARNPYRDYFKNDRLMFDVKHHDERLPKKTRVIGILGTPEPLAIPLAAIHDAGGEISIDTPHGPIVITADADTGNVSIEKIPDSHRAVHTFWFSWAAMHEETEIFEP